MSGGPVSLNPPQQVGGSASGGVSGAQILAIAPTPFFGDYGCHVRIVEEITALQTHGVGTELLTYPFGRDIAGIKTHRSPRLPGQQAVSPGSSVHKLWMDAALSASAVGLVARTRPDLIHGHLHEGALIGWAVGRPRRTPIVFDFQGSLTAEMVDHGFLTPSSPSFALFRRIEQWVVAHADAVITSTSHGADVLMRQFGCPTDRITVVPDAVNSTRFCPIGERPAGSVDDQREVLRARLGLTADRPIVVYLGLLAEYQGITHLLRAAEALKERKVDAHFLIMGYPGEDRYRVLAHRLGLGDRVTFTGAIRYEEAPDYLALGTVAVAPKLSLTEGNGKLLNYMSMGLPTLAYDSPVSREILGELGVYAPPGDWTALSIELEAMLREPAALTQRGRALRAKAACQHTWEQAIEPLVALYQGLLG